MEVSMTVFRFGTARKVPLRRAPNPMAATHEGTGVAFFPGSFPTRARGVPAEELRYQVRSGGAPTLRPLQAPRARGASGAGHRGRPTGGRGPGRPSSPARPGVKYLEPHDRAAADTVALLRAHGPRSSRGKVRVVPGGTPRSSRGKACVVPRVNRVVSGVILRSCGGKQLIIFLQNRGFFVDFPGLCSFASCFICFVARENRRSKKLLYLFAKRIAGEVGLR